MFAGQLPNIGHPLILWGRCLQGGKAFAENGKGKMENGKWKRETKNLFFISRERSSIIQTRMVEWVSWSGWEKMYFVWLVAVRAVPGVEAMLVSSDIRVGQKRIEGLCELKTLQSFPSAIICLLPFLSGTVDSLDTPDAPARKGS